MKTRILVSSILIMAVAGLMSFKYLSNSSPEPVKNLADSISHTERFLIGSMETIGDSQYNYVHYDSLGLNLWQAYLHHTESSNGIVYPKGQMSSGDTLFAPVNSYSAELQSEMADIYSHNETRLLMTRPKIEWLCYGQRSDYQCEQDHIDAMLWFYSFQTAGHVGGVDSNDNRYGNGAWVRYFRSQNSNCPGSWVDPPGVVISKLKANTEQCRIQPSNEKGGRWQYDNQFLWKIKPRIRIDESFASANKNARVCRLIIKNDLGVSVNETDIRVRNFFPHQDSGYEGGYLEEFYFQVYGDTSNLDFYGPWGTGNKAFWQARGNRDSADNKADIQIYWYGECDMWIDYVRVDNEIADKLFKGYYEESGRQWIQDEVEQIALYKPQGDIPAAYNLYLELTEFNNLPCMAYVNRRLKYYATQLGGSQFKVDLAADFHFRYSIHVPWENKSTVMNYDHIKRFWIDSVGMTTFLAECYPFNNDESPVTSESVGRIPETLKRTHCQGSDPCDIFARPVPPADFDDWLQDNLDHEPYYFAADNEQFTVRTHYGKEAYPVSHSILETKYRVSAIFLSFSCLSFIHGFLTTWRFISNQPMSSLIS